MQAILHHSGSLQEAGFDVQVGHGMQRFASCSYLYSTSSLHPCGRIRLHYFGNNRASESIEHKMRIIGGNLGK